MTTGLGVIAFCLVCVPASAFAQEGSLERGQFELRGFGGAAYSGNYSISADFAAGAELAFGIDKYFAVTGHYTFDGLGNWHDPVGVEESRNAHEFMGGIRVPIPNRSRLTPYVALDVGGINLRDSISGPTSFPAISSFSYLSSSNHFAAAVGVGANYRLTPRTGINVDVRGVVASCGLSCTPPWFLRTTAGFYFQFGRTR